VPRIYLEEKRSFGGVLDNGDTRLEYYRQVIDRSLEKAKGQRHRTGLAATCCPGTSSC